jgi:Ca2+-binding EF-hand superfamily protein
MSSSGLPAHELAHIWKISDVDQDSRLTVSEFLCVLAISAKRRGGASLPEVLPVELQQLVGSPPQKPAAVETQPLWTVSSAELDTYQKIFDSIDSAGVGAIRRAEVQAVLETSQLSQLDLDRIWDLVGATDLRLREFACALALTSRRREGLTLPTEVPQELASQVQQLTAT